MDVGRYCAHVSLWPYAGVRMREYGYVGTCMCGYMGI